MKKPIQLALVASVVFMLAGCGEPTLDTSSDEAMKESVQEIMADLSEEDQKRFKKTLTGIYMLAALSSMGDGNSEDAKAKINAKLDGKTAEEVFQFAEEIKKKMKN